MIYLWEVAASFTETFLGIWFPAKALENKKISLKKNVLFAVFLTLVVAILNQYAIFSVLTSILGIILLSCGTSFVYRIKYFYVLPMMGFYMVLIYLYDFLILSFLGILLNRPDFAIYATSNLSSQRVLFLIISKSVLILGSLFIAKLYFKFSLKRYAIVLFYLSESIILFYMVMRTLSNADIDIFLLWLFLLLLNAAGIYSAAQHSIAIEQKENNSIEKKKNKLLAEDYKSLMSNYNHKRIFYHDLKNQYLVIKSYLEQEEYKKVEEYIKKMHSFSHEVEISTYTGIDILDLILSHKVYLAREQGSNVNIMAEPIRLRLTEVEIVAIMSNILDNAIEACQEVKENEKWIQVVIRQIGDISFIKIANSCIPPNNAESNVLMSRKKDHEVHGIGLISVQSIVEKYGGAVDVNYGDEEFTIAISFFN